MIGRFCGSTLPKGGNIISTHNLLYFWFRSDNTTSHEGFELTWNSIDPSKNCFFLHFLMKKKYSVIYSIYLKFVEVSCRSHRMERYHRRDLPETIHQIVIACGFLWLQLVKDCNSISLRCSWRLMKLVTMIIWL